MIFAVLTIGGVQAQKAIVVPSKAQKTIVFPTKIEHNGANAELYREISLLVVDASYTGTEDSINNVLKQNKLQPVTINDSLQKPYTTNGRNRWLTQKSAQPWSDIQYLRLQSDLPPGLYLAPAYRSAGGTVDEVFVPLPNVIVIDKESVNGADMDFLKNNATLDTMRSKRQVALSIFNITARKANAYFIVDRLVARNASLSEHVRYENQPLISDRQMESLSASTSTQYNQWNMQIIHAQPGEFKPQSLVKVGVLDFGCDLTHTGLNLKPGVNLNNASRDGRTVRGISHGTWMAGIIGANNSSGLISVAPNVIIIPIARESETDVEVADGISYCINHGIDVINMSFGKPGRSSTGGTAWNFANIDPTISRAFNAGLTLVAAAGNETSYGKMAYPARNALVIAVGGADEDDKRMPFPNYGDINYLGTKTGISVVAPGDTLWTTTPGSVNMEIVGKTSAATAHVSGFAAFLKAYKPSMTNTQIRNMIESTADKIETNRLNYTNTAGFPNGKRHPEVGYGRINIAKALDKINPAWRQAARVIPINTLIQPIVKPADPSQKHNWWIWLIVVAVVVLVIILVARKKRK